MTLRIEGIPPLYWTGVEGDASFDGHRLTLRSAAGVDWTNSALGGDQQHAATALAFEAPAGDFTLAARIRVPAPRSTFDAGALALWRNSDHWAKVCNEYSPDGEPMVVSVVTNEFSDDCNSAPFSHESVWLRVARVGRAFAFHSSSDGRRWDFVRLFRLAGDVESLSVGFLAQAPTGDSCIVEFDAMSLSLRRIEDLRDGS